jgi:hypothetical protein
MTPATRARGYAHYVLAAIRLANGALALFAPTVLARRIGVNARESTGILYFERMFGIRTILIALDLVSGDRRHAARAIRVGRVIHASDAASAALAGLSGNLRPRAAVLTTAISLINLMLAFASRPPRRSRLARIKRPNPFGG